MTKWISDEQVAAMAYDYAIAGNNTFNTNCLRRWKAKPYFESHSGT